MKHFFIGPDRMIPFSRIEAQEHKLIKDLTYTEERIAVGNLAESWHDILQVKEEAQKMFELGLLNLDVKGRVETLFWRIAERMQVARAGGKRCVPGAGQSAGVGVVAVAEPDPVLLHALKTVGAVQLCPARMVVTAHLIEHDEHDELCVRAGRLRLRHGWAEREVRADSNPRNQQRSNDEKEHTTHDVSKGEPRPQGRG